MIRKKIDASTLRQAQGEAQHDPSTLRQAQGDAQGALRQAQGDVANKGWRWYCQVREKLYLPADLS